MRFSLRTILLLTAIAAVLVGCTVSRTQASFLIACVLVPATLAMLTHFDLGMNHGRALPVALMSASCIGATYLAIGSYSQTFVAQSQGFLVGDGWYSVIAGALVGGFIGAFCGLAAILIYSCFVGLIWIWQPSEEK